MENYFKGQKPGFDALIAMARGFKGPVSYLCGVSEADSGETEKLVFEATPEEFLYLLWRIHTYTKDGVPVFKSGTAFGVPIEEYDEDRATDVLSHYSSVARFYAKTAEREGECCARETASLQSWVMGQFTHNLAPATLKTRIIFRAHLD